MNGENLSQEEKREKATRLVKELHNLQLSDEELDRINAGSTDVNISYKNESNDSDNSQIIIFHKN